ESALRLEREQTGAGDVLHMDEVAPLPAVLEHERRLVVEKSGGENRQYAGIWIGQGLTRPVDVEESQCDRRHLVGPAGDQAKPLLGVLVQRIDRGEPRLLGF